MPDLVESAMVQEFPPSPRGPVRWRVHRLELLLPETSAAAASARRPSLARTRSPAPSISCGVYGPGWEVTLPESAASRSCAKRKGVATPAPSCRRASHILWENDGGSLLEVRLDTIAQLRDSRVYIAASSSVACGARGAATGRAPAGRPGSLEVRGVAVSSATLGGVGGGRGGGESCRLLGAFVLPLDVLARHTAAGKRTRLAAERLPDEGISLLGEDLGLALASCYVEVSWSPLRTFSQSLAVRQSSSPQKPSRRSLSSSPEAAQAAAHAAWTGRLWGAGNTFGREPRPHTAPRLEQRPCLVPAHEAARRLLALERVELSTSRALGKQDAYARLIQRWWRCFLHRYGLLRQLALAPPGGYRGKKLANAAHPQPAASTMPICNAAHTDATSYSRATAKAAASTQPGSSSGPRPPRKCQRHFTGGTPPLPHQPSGARSGGGLPRSASGGSVCAAAAREDWEPPGDAVAPQAKKALAVWARPMARVAHAASATPSPAKKALAALASPAPPPAGSALDFLLRSRRAESRIAAGLGYAVS